MAEEVLNELRRLTAGALNRRTETGIPRVAMVQGEVPAHQLAAVYEPMVNLILQGGKTLHIGERTLRYDPASYFVMTLDMPATGAVHAAGPGQPYLAVSLTLDPSRIAALLADMAEATPAPAPAAPGSFSVCHVTPELLDAWARLLRLMHTPADIPALAPAYEREILYRVLQGPQGALLREIATPQSTLSRIRHAIAWLRQHHDQPIQVEQLAESAAMSASAFHRHFKAATAMSPIQFQKQLRLLRARQLLVTGGPQAAAVAFEVGYESASQFSREYARFFGQPPAKDAAQIREQIREQCPAPARAV